MNAFDVHLFLAIHHALSGFVVPLAVLSAIGGGWGAFFAVPLYFWRRTRDLARTLGVVLVVTAVLVFSLKMLFARVRPCACIEGIHALVFKQPTDFSFPSGHAAGSFAFTVFLAKVLLRERTPLRVAAAIALVLLAVLVGLSRIALGVHFPGDVLAGAILGSTVALLGASRITAGPFPEKRIS